MSVLSERLKELREKKKKDNSMWTQQYVADKIGVARVTYTAYENGSKLPPVDTTNNIAKLFNVSTDYLTGRMDATYTIEEIEKFAAQINENEDDFIEKMRKISPSLPEERKKLIIDIANEFIRRKINEENS